jgi:hypothetical protein
LREKEVLALTEAVQSLLGRLEGGGAKAR